MGEDVRAWVDQVVADAFLWQRERNVALRAVDAAPGHRAVRITTLGELDEAVIAGFRAHYRFPMVFVSGDPKPKPTGE
ncbi:MAG: hypothetical protein ACRDRL_08920 [Sciscionella sp.]